MKQDKLAIVKSDQDLLRVIPWRNKTLDGSPVEFKIALLGNTYSLEYWPIQESSPEGYTVNSEITYHCSKLQSGHLFPGTVHVKGGEQIDDRLYRLRFPKVVDVPVDAEFPIPILRLAIRDDVDSRYKPRPYHFVLDLDDSEVIPSNVVEVYAVGKAFDPKRFPHRWPSIHHLWMITTIDYVTHGVHLSEDFLARITSGPVLDGIGYKFEEMDLVVRLRTQDVETNLISFYENYHYLNALAMAPIQLVEDQTGQPLSDVAPAFALDLEHQRRSGVPGHEVESWERFFIELDQRLEDPWDTSRQVCFQIPQVK